MTGSILQKIHQGIFYCSKMAKTEQGSQQSVQPKRKGGKQFLKISRHPMQFYNHTFPVGKYSLSITYLDPSLYAEKPLNKVAKSQVH